MQASAVKNKTFTREAYMEIIAKKTAALFQASRVRSAPSSQERNERDIRAVSDFGFQIGLAFQIVDDILDLVEDESKLGKTSGIDVTQGRGVAVALSNSNGNGRRHCQRSAV